MTDIAGPWYCHWCDSVITLGGELVTEEADAYWHAYDHQDCAPYAFEVMERFEQLDTVAADEHVPQTDGSVTTTRTGPGADDVVGGDGDGR